MSTEATARQASFAEPEGTFRAELSARIDATAAQIEAAMAENSRAAGDAGGAGEAQSQLAVLAALQSAITTAQPAALPLLQAKLAWSLPAAQTIASQLRAATAQAATQAAELTNISEATRRTTRAVADDLFERRIFDPYLKFGSAAEEADYRQREADARRYMEDQLAKNTATGTLNATGAVAGQMLDAHANGAGDSPDFVTRWNDITQALDKQRSLMRAQGLSTEECDQNLRESVRRYLATKGLSPGQTEAQLRQSADPLDAVKPYLRTGDDAKALQAEIATDAQQKGAKVPELATGQNAEQRTAGGWDAITATLQASGVALAATDQPQGHGIGDNAAMSRNQRSV